MEDEDGNKDGAEEVELAPILFQHKHAAERDLEGEATATTANESHSRRKRWNRWFVFALLLAVAALLLACTLHYAWGRSKSLTTMNEKEPSSQHQKQKHCEVLKAQHGFWTNRQCELWNMIENGTTADMAPYEAENVPAKERFWSTNQTGTPGSGPDGRLIYHLHLHKCMGSTFCSWFRKARFQSSSQFSAKVFVDYFTKQMANPENNCNVPDKWWWDPSKPDLHYQWGAYMGENREKMASVYRNIRKKGWIYVASEGSLSDEPIFGEDGPYYYSVILREPTAWVISMWHYNNWYHGKKNTLDVYLRKVLLGKGVPDFYTRRICGSSCVHNDPLTMQDFLQAKSRLSRFDLVLAQDMVEDANATSRLLKSEFPDLTFPSIERKANVGSYSRAPNLTAFQLEFIRNQTMMDKVLYEYAKMLHQNKLAEIID